MRSNRLAGRLWLSMAVLIGGYVASVGTGYVLNSLTERRALHVQEASHPAARQAAWTRERHEDLLNLQRTAVLLGESTMLADATELPVEIADTLQALASLASLPGALETEASALVLDVRRLGEDAGLIYGDLIGAGDAPTAALQARSRPWPSDTRTWAHGSRSWKRAPRRSCRRTSTPSGA